MRTLLTILLTSVASIAGAQNMVMHNGSLMRVDQDRSGLVRISYVDPRPALRAIGVGPGVQLLWGRWVAPNRFEATARTFEYRCTYEYRVKGGLIEGGVLYLEGPAPVIMSPCWVSRFSWTIDDAHLAFVPYQTQ